MGITWGVWAVEEVAGSVREMEEGETELEEVCGCLCGGLRGELGMVGREWVNMGSCGCLSLPFLTPWNVSPVALPLKC